jgi:hypothetical protein
MRGKLISIEILTRPVFQPFLKLVAIMMVFLTSSATCWYAMDYWQWHQDVRSEALAINLTYYRILDEIESETATITVCSQLIQVGVDHKRMATEDLLRQTLELEQRNQCLIDRYTSRLPSNLIRDGDETYNLLKTQESALRELAKHLNEVDLFFDFLSSTTLTDYRENEIKNFYDAGDWSAAKLLVNDCLGQIAEQEKITRELQQTMQHPLSEIDTYLNKHKEYLKTLSFILNAKERGQKKDVEELTRTATVLNLEMSLISPDEDLQTYWEKIIVDQRLACNKTRLLAESESHDLR